ncbi:MAG TPA: hypothetical protein VFH63_11660 [candidate division Zixibacteria bacterium]|nr:hypothetical protein [candidate division Zixibacteria bacterium]
MAIAGVGTMLAFWTQPFGTYDGVVRDQGPAAIGGVLSVGGSAIMAVGLVGFAASAVRARVLHWLSAIGLVIGAFLAFPWLHESVQGAGLGVALVAISALMLLERA